jgi:hypothetical protein
LLTVTPLVKRAPNWLPQPTGQVALGLAMVESPAIHTVTGAAAAGAAPFEAEQDAGRAAEAAADPVRVSGTARASTASQWSFRMVSSKSARK